MRSSKLILALLPCALWAQIGGSFLSGDLVRGGSALVTPGLVPTVSALGTLGQSDVSLASGIFSRAGTVGLSATGANVVTFSVNSSEIGRWSANGRLLVGTTTDDGTNKLNLAGSIGLSHGDAYNANINHNAYYSSGWKYVGNGYASGVYLNDSANGHISFWNAANNSGGAGAAMTVNTRLRIAASGNVLVGTTSDDGSSKLQVAGVITANGAGGGVQINTRNSGANWTQYVDAGTLSFYNGSQNLLTISSAGTATLYNPTATTGVTSAVIRAGAGQGSTDLMQWQNNAGATLAKITADGTVVSNLAINSPYITTTGSGTNKTVLSLTSAGSRYGTLQVESTAGAGAWSLGHSAAATSAVGTKVFTWTGDDKVGFFGVTPVVRQTATDLATVLTALQNLGLIN